MKSLNKTETPLFLSVMCSLFQKAIFWTFVNVLVSQLLVSGLTVCLVITLASPYNVNSVNPTLKSKTGDYRCILFLISALNLDYMCMLEHPK